MPKKRSEEGRAGWELAGGVDRRCAPWMAVPVDPGAEEEADHASPRELQEGAGHGSTPRRSIRQPVARRRVSSRRESRLAPAAGRRAGWLRPSYAARGRGRWAAALPESKAQEQRKRRVGERDGGRGRRGGKKDLKSWCVGPAGGGWDGVRDIGDDGCGEIGTAL
jgi:hypothetical protein